MNISSLIPTPEDFSRLTPQDIGLRLLRVIDSLPDSMKHRYNYLNFAENLAGYPEERWIEIRRALNEAWVWLSSNGYIAPSPTSSNPEFIYITPKGREGLGRAEVGANRSGQGSPPAPPLPASAGLSDTFLYWSHTARLTLACRCVARVTPLFVPDQVRRRESARRDVISLDASWKLAGLTSLGMSQPDSVVDAIGEASESARGRPQ